MNGDNRQQQDDERRQREEGAINAYADAMVKRDMIAAPSVGRTWADRYYTDAPWPDTGIKWKEPK